MEYTSDHSGSHEKEDCFGTGGISVRSDYVLPDEEDIETEGALVCPDELPVRQVINSDDAPNGVFLATGQDRLLEVAKAELVFQENKRNGLDDGFEVRWDEREPWDIIAVLEGCGSRPTLLDDRRAEESAQAAGGNWSGDENPTARRPFDPKAPHFDVVVVSLQNSPYFPFMQAVGTTHWAPTPLDALPLESLLGRPGFVLIRCGKTPAGLNEGRRLFDVWGVKRLEVCAPVQLPFPFGRKLSWE